MIKATDAGNKLLKLRVMQYNFKSFLYHKVIENGNSNGQMQEL